ncbi:amidohydrolase family protein [Traorella massiliensis]|uniref:N-acyl-D-amino-acid deacylase family protein n=1 Tax=Traorella massiliensis TaxID=1903263 RepID=UPI00248EE0E9|nr:amidohydrolase family protein [Traorella massiliensis]
MYDLIIKNGRIVDGTGKDAFLGDIAITDGKIADIGILDEKQALSSIDAKKHWVTPGFIDPHSHADMSLLVWPQNEAYAMQGVTTLICGNCGLAAGPIGDETWEFWCWEYKSVNRVHKTIFQPYTFQTDAKKMKEALKEDYHLDVTWKTLGEFMDIAEQKGFSCNYYPLSGHNHIRNAVMGCAQRPATREEIEQMKALLYDDMEHGSQGFSTGLDYLPGRFATMEEILELVKVAAEYDGVYNTHVRGFDPENPQISNRLYGVREATEICRRTGIKTNISHMSSLYSYSPSINEEIEKQIARASVLELEKGWREEGLPMMYDVIANPSMGGSTIPYLISLLRPWVLMCGSIENFIDKLAYDDFIEMMKEQVKGGKAMMLADKEIVEMIYIEQCACLKYSNKSLRQIMEEENNDDLIDILINIVSKDAYTTMTFRESGGEDTVKILLDSERSMPCADGFSFNLETEMDLPRPLNRLPHPNNYCFAIRYLLNYGPQRFEDKIRQMTKVPADWFNISDRGTLEKGKWADIVILDQDHLRTNEDPVNPGKAPDGIDYVIINGKITVDHKKHTGMLNGKILRKIHK